MRYKKQPLLYLSIILSCISHTATAETYQLNDIYVTEKTPITSSDGLLNNSKALSHVFIDKDQLKHERRNTLGDTISRQAGLQMESYGASSGKPVIRAYNTERVITLNNGLSANGSASISTHYPLGLQTKNIQSIKVIKSGSATRYGGQAIGGAVVTDDQLILTQLPEKRFQGELDSHIAYNNPFSQHLILKGHEGRFAWHLQTDWSYLNKTRIPGWNKSEKCLDGEFIFGEAVAKRGCQVSAPFNSVVNKSYYKYIRAHIDDDALREDPGAKYTDNPTSNIPVKPYFINNIPNPEYDPVKYPDDYKRKIQWTSEWYNVARSKEFLPVVHLTPYTKGYIANTAAQQQNFSLGASYLGDGWLVGGAIRYQHHNYGVPGFTFDASKTGQAGQPVKISSHLFQEQARVATNINHSFFKRAEINLAHTRQKTEELLGSAISTGLRNSQYEGRLIVDHEWQLTEDGYSDIQVRGQWGADFQTSYLRTYGADRYIPHVDYSQKGLFIIEQLEHSKFFAEIGYRHEWVHYQPDATDFKTSRNATNNRVGFLERNFHLNQAHLDINYKPTSFLDLNYSYSHSERAPSSNALFAANQHMAILAIEAGNSLLNKEINNTHEIGIKLHYHPFSIRANLYRTKYHNYIYLAYTSGIARDLYYVRYWRSSDHTIHGLELELNGRYDMGEWGELSGRIFGDFVYNRIDQAYNANENEVESWVPVSRYGMTIDWEKDNWKLNLSATRYLTQKEAAHHGEIPLPSYTIVDTRIGYQWSDRLEASVSIKNLLNAEGRANNSPVKYIAPVPGRSIDIGINYKF